MLDGIYRLMQSKLEGPVNIGNPEYVTVDELVQTVAAAAGKRIKIRHVDGPVGVLSRNFSNSRIESMGWRAQWPLWRKSLRRRSIPIFGVTKQMTDGQLLTAARANASVDVSVLASTGMLLKSIWSAPTCALQITSEAMPAIKNLPAETIVIQLRAPAIRLEEIVAARRAMAA